jgi:hypothetical protein
MRTFPMSAPHLNSPSVWPTARRAERATSHSNRNFEYTQPLALTLSTPYRPCNTMRTPSLDRPPRLDGQKVCPNAHRLMFQGLPASWPRLMNLSVLWYMFCWIGLQRSEEERRRCGELMVGSHRAVLVKKLIARQLGKTGKIE